MSTGIPKANERKPDLFRIALEHNIYCRRLWARVWKLAAELLLACRGFGLAVAQKVGRGVLIAQWPFAWVPVGFGGIGRCDLPS